MTKRRLEGRSMMREVRRSESRGEKEQQEKKERWGGEWRSQGDHDEGGYQTWMTFWINYYYLRSIALLVGSTRVPGSRSMSECFTVYVSKYSTLVAV